jgi:copper chaperone CopZ
MDKIRVEENLKRPDGVTETKYRKSNRDEINAEYDAKLLALQNSIDSSKKNVNFVNEDVTEQSIIDKLKNNKLDC